MRPEPRPPRRPDPDLGLAAVRTRLAWRRTALAVGVVAVLTARLALAGGTVGAVVAALAGLSWLAVLVVAFNRLGGPLARLPGRPGAVLPLIALSSAGFAGLGVLLVLASMR
ncbi:DUF202 domain-containing protein [Plantactinospora soyae]|uniref:DUF202 domain-containing protein n=1 Tax=Plantactinospora soyae TaxID=1544732 RepID=A0A927QYA1_9ACTN|nr:DUF202 domain-containing protein [Plantactinospora soyae]MBE1487637.1 hypothetical protein [Plantactinospora soyae]